MSKVLSWRFRNSFNKLGVTSSGAKLALHDTIKALRADLLVNIPKNDFKKIVTGRERSPIFMFRSPIFMMSHKW